MISKELFEGPVGTTVLPAILSNACVYYVLFLFQKLKLTKSRKPYDRKNLSRVYQVTLSGKTRQYGVPDFPLETEQDMMYRLSIGRCYAVHNVGREESC